MLSKEEQEAILAAFEVKAEAMMDSFPDDGAYVHDKGNP